MITGHFSGPDAAVNPVCVCLSGQISFELDDIPLT